MRRHGAGQKIFPISQSQHQPAPTVHLYKNPNFSSWTRQIRVVLTLGCVLMLMLMQTGVKGSHLVCLSDSGVKRETDGLPCIWFEGKNPKNLNAIQGVCQDSYCKPNKLTPSGTKPPHVAKQILENIRRGRNQWQSSRWDKSMGTGAGTEEGSGAPSDTDTNPAAVLVSKTDDISVMSGPQNSTS